jgi:hypothetical protein
LKSEISEFVPDLPHVTGGLSWKDGQGRMGRLTRRQHLNSVLKNGQQVFAFADRRQFPCGKKGLNIEKALEVREDSAFYAVEQGEDPP